MPLKCCFANLDYSMRGLSKYISLGVLCVLCAKPALADVVVRDDANNEVRLAAPAKRIVSLAPHITETLFAAGAGKQVVATVEFSDYPAAAQKLPRVGSYAQIDLEAVVAAKPDLVVVWQSGNASASIDKLRALGLKLFVSQPDSIEDVVKTVERFGILAATSTQAKPAATALRKRYERLRQRYSMRPPVRMFYQVWEQPLMTVGGKQIIGSVIRLCGGENVFARLEVLAPTVSVEAVLAADPEVIVAGGMGSRNAAWLDAWRQWPRMTAVAKNNLFFINPDLMQRHTPRLLDGAEQLCQILEKVRSQRPAN